jgi:hypothetical protein
MKPVYQPSHRSAICFNNHTRGIVMKLLNVLWIAIALLLPGTAWAYGDINAGNNMIPCTAKFSRFTPPNNTEVAPKSEFSFYASTSTNPSSIRVTIKEQLVPITVTTKHDGLHVTGKIPATVKATYAKINLVGKGPNQCEATAGWLVKVK